MLAAGLAGRTSSRVSHWNAWTSTSSPKFPLNDNNTQLTISRSLHTNQGVSSCLQHCLRSARYLPDFQSSSSPPPQVSIYRLPTLQNQIILFSLLFPGPIPTHTACSYPPLCVSCVGIAGRSGVLQKKTQKNAPPFTCTPTFSFRAFSSRKLITFISESQEVVPPGPVLSLSRARTSPLVTGMTVSLSTMPKRTPPRLPSRP